MDDKVIGGVCSGIAAYFNLEPLLFRIIFVVLALFSSFGFGFSRLWFPHHIGISIGGWAILAYIILWIVIPAAKTVAQKCEMRGERPDFSGIQDRVKRGAEYVEREVRRGAESVGPGVLSGIGRVIGICVGIMLILITIPILIALPVSLIFTSSLFNWVLPSGVASIVAFHGNILWIKILGALVLLLPFVGILYGGIALVFRLRPQRMRPGLFIFVLWLLSIIALAIVSALAVRPYYAGVEEARKELPVQIHSDTLYIHYANSLEIPRDDFGILATASEASLFWFEGGRKNFRAVAYPRIRIIRADSEQPLHIELIGEASGRYMNEAFTRAEESIPACTLQDSLLTIFPNIFTRNNKWQGNRGEVLIYLPKGKEAVLTAPYRHHFDRSAPRISKGAVAKGKYYGIERPNWNRSEDRWNRWEEKWNRSEEKWNRWEEKWNRSEEKWNRWDKKWNRSQKRWERHRRH